MDRQDEHVEGFVKYISAVVKVGYSILKSGHSMPRETWADESTLKGEDAHIGEDENVRAATRLAPDIEPPQVDSSLDISKGLSRMVRGVILFQRAAELGLILKVRTALFL